MNVLQRAPQSGAPFRAGGKALGGDTKEPLVQSRSGKANSLRLQEPTFRNPFNTTCTNNALNHRGALKSMNLNGLSTPPLTPPSTDKPNPFASKSTTQMNALALKTILRDLPTRKLRFEEDVSSLWSDILSTTTSLNSPSPHTLEEQPAASRHHDVTTFMTYAVCTRADWLPHHNTVNLILYNHHDATQPSRPPSSYGTWQPAVSKMTLWLRERHHSYDDYLSQPTFGIIAAGRKFLVLMLYSGSKRACGEPDEEGNVRVRDLGVKEDQDLLQRLLQHVASASPLQESVGFDDSIPWAPLEVGTEEDAGLLNSGRRDSRSEKKKPALGALQAGKVAAVG